MRVLHVTSSFPREEGEATGQFVADLAAAERDAGLDVRVLAPHVPGAPVSGTIGGVPVHRFRYGPDRLEVLGGRGGLMTAARVPSGAAMVAPFVAGMAAATRWQCRRWHPNLVHAHWWLPGGLAAMTSGVPYVVTLHGSDVELIERRGLRQLARLVVARAAATVAVSEALADRSARLLGGPVGVAPMPVMVGEPIVVDGPAPPAGAGLWAVAVGRLAPEKGFDILIEALRRATVPMHLDVVGAGPLLDSLRRQAAGLDVTWHGALPRTELHELMAGANVVVVPSRREGLGLVAVEAVLLGRPVIASEVGGLPAVLGAEPEDIPAGLGRLVDGGALVPPEDVEALATALDSAESLGHPGPLAKAAAARHRPAAVAELHRDLYQRAGTLAGS